MEIKITLASQRRTSALRPDKPLPFAALRTDHIFLMDYVDGAWRNPRLVPYGPLALAPGALVLHYGQAIFEGIKAYQHADGELYTFRADRNAQRFNSSARTMCMPEIPVEMQLEAIHALLDLDRLWFPEQEAASFYIRPFMFGEQDILGVRPSATYTYCVMIAPSGPYYPGGRSKPVRLLITDKFHRAAPGGTGTAKCAGNYGTSIRAGAYAQSKGLGQVLYLDVTNQLVEECGTMNHFQITSSGELITPALTDTILAGITTESALELSSRLRLKPKRATIRVNEMLDQIRSGQIQEAGGLGTAAVVVATSAYVLEDGTEIKVGSGEVGPETSKLYNLLTGMQRGTSEAPTGWLQQVERRA